MIRRHVMGKEGMTLALAAALAMAAVAFFCAAPQSLGGDMGICLPSPNRWGMTPPGGWIFNLSALLVATVTLYFFNKQFTVVQGSDTVLTGMFIFTACSNVWVSGILTSSGIMALANLICLSVLFGCWQKHNATQEMFLIATILAVGSMFQYAFIFMTPVYLLGAMMLKCFNFRCLVAYLMGLAAPYWVAVGLGIVSVDAFTMPTFTNLFDGFASRSGLLVGMLNVAVTAFIGLILAFNNGVRLYAGNTQRRLYNMVVDLLGVACVMCMLLDFNNMVAYMATLYMITAFQLANLFALWHVHRGGLWLFMLSLLYVAAYLIMILG